MARTNATQTKTTKTAVKTTKSAAKTTKTTAKTTKTTAKKTVKSAKPGTRGPKSKTTPALGKTLVIVESPAKAKTIEKFLGTGYYVTACNGHVIDLPKSTLGVDVEANFEPKYIVIRGKTGLLNDLKKMGKEAKKVLLATDPDREGEAISWHIAGALDIDKSTKCRVEFNEITKNAVTAAISQPRSIDQTRVDEQQARRVIDRLVGYKLSPLLWAKVARGLSAGRVQSVAVRIIVDRENEINGFNPREYWTITAGLADSKGKRPFEAKYIGTDGKKIEPSTEGQANEILKSLKQAKFVLQSTKWTKRLRKPYAPFTTSTLQQDASAKLGFSPRKTMAIAQGLYEGVAVSSSETVGLITYMRTDSVRVSAEALSAVREYIAKRYGAEFLPESANYYSGRKNAQDAHEAIRPTYIVKTPESLKSILTTEQYKLYNLIFTRFLASQMSSAVYDSGVFEISADKHDFRASGSKLVFHGFLTAYNAGADDDGAALPDIAEGENLTVREILPKQNFTAPPPRFTEASLVKMLEEKGIGRPSTYAPIISTIQDRGYVGKDKKALVPTELGGIVTDLMKTGFSDIVDVAFTAEMEEKLDDIRQSGRDWKEIMAEFYTPFEKQLIAAQDGLEHAKVPVKLSGIICEKCGAEMVHKKSRYGEFIACPNYPTCKNTKNIKKAIEMPCPKCGAEIFEKRTKTGKPFYGCSKYPECDFSSWDLPLLEKCPICDEYMVIHKGQNRAAYKTCSNVQCPGKKRKAKKPEQTEQTK